MSVNKLPKPGDDFDAKDGYDSFKKKLYSATRYGDLKNLNNNLEAIIETIDDYEDYIQKGGLSSGMRYRAFAKIKKRSSDLSRDDERDIKKILKYLSR